ncbi:acetylcholinesterase-like [Acanthaster planci]|uniref:Carboxylic ester hydrolase n=1 Tax=Acanthaster planci TaxID=133434 RepID=A0A8B7ZL03_ACAPL|nr:acetylcholinesterase-like [Acanthaster planci]
MNLCVFACLLVLVGSAMAGPLIQTLNGRIEGVTETFKEDKYLKVDKKIDIYRGIPYAEPPLGLRRFQPPVPVNSWSGTLNAARHGPACIQYFISFSGMDEDCLFLDVYRPHTVSKTAAVMVFIHGGAFFFGYGSMPEYLGQPISAVGDVIYVAINYRLGPFGFLSTGDSEAPGNVGLLDQVLALKWVKNNIHRFGGDPDNITIFGESAGGASVSFHLVSKHSRGLFTRAIMQSGTSTSFFAYQRSLDYAKNQAKEVGLKAGCPTGTTAEMISCLQALPARKFRSIAYKVGLAYLPVVDGSFLHDKPENILAAGDFQKLDILIGAMRDEGSLVALAENLFSFFASKAPPMSHDKFLKTYPGWIYNYGDVANNAAMKQAIEARYVSDSQAADPTSDYLDNFIKIMTDYIWIVPTEVTAQAHLREGNKVYMYQMTHTPTVSIFHIFFLGPKWVGAIHADDLPFVFGNSWIPKVFYKIKKPLPEERMMSNTIMKYWTNFAKTGSPNDGVVPNWPEYNLDKKQYKDISVYFPTKSGGIRQDYVSFWTNDIPKLVTRSDVISDPTRGIEAFIDVFNQVEQCKAQFDENEVHIHQENNDS